LPTAIVIQILNGLDKGGAYALIALGLTLAFGTLGIVNFAHGALFMMGAFCAVTVQKLLTISARVRDMSVTFFEAYKETPYLELWWGDAGKTLIEYSVPLSILIAIPVMALVVTVAVWLGTRFSGTRLYQSDLMTEDTLTVHRSISVMQFMIHSSVMAITQSEWPITTKTISKTTVI